MPCSVCGLDTPHARWFLVAENCWRDRLRVFRWNPSLAAHRGYKSACCQQHLKVLISFWVERANFRLLLRGDPPVPIAGPSLDDWAAVPPTNWNLLGELSVHREMFSREWTGSPETLDAIVDALVSSVDISRPQATPLHRSLLPRESPYHLSR